MQESEFKFIKTTINKYTDLMKGLSLSVYLNKEKKKT
jgi:hypothetical protein